jgi:hypothetical protein
VETVLLIIVGLVIFPSLMTLVVFLAALQRGRPPGPLSYAVVGGLIVLGILGVRSLVNAEWVYWLFPVGLALPVLPVYWWSRRATRNRTEELASVAQRLGLRYSSGADDSLARTAVRLEPAGGALFKYADNVLSGDWRGTPVRAFEYRYTKLGGEAPPPMSLSCAVADLPQPHPRVVVRDATAFRSLALRLHLVGTRLRDDEFYSTMNVDAENDDSARDMLTADFRHSILSRAEGQWSYLVERTTVLCCRGAPLSRDTEALLDGLLELREHAIGGAVVAPPIAPASDEDDEGGPLDTRNMTNAQSAGLLGVGLMAVAILLFVGFLVLAGVACQTGSGCL